MVCVGTVLEGVVVDSIVVVVLAKTDVLEEVFPTLLAAKFRASSEYHSAFPNLPDTAEY